MPNRVTFQHLIAACQTDEQRAELCLLLAMASTAMTAIALPLTSGTERDAMLKDLRGMSDAADLCALGMSVAANI